MATASELTLRVVEYLQCGPDADAESSPARWMFVPPPTRWPGGPGLTFAEAASHLDGLQKPVFVGALDHPGIVAVWPRNGLMQAEADYLDSLVKNQLAAHEDLQPALGSPGATPILFDTGTDPILVPLDDFMQWLRDYGLTWGWRLGIATDPGHRARAARRRRGR